MSNVQSKTRVFFVVFFFNFTECIVHWGYITQLSCKAQLFVVVICFFFPQVMSLSPAPLSLLIKAAPILTEEMYGDIQPAAWELLLSVDEHMAGAAGKGTKSVSVASQTDQLTAGHRTLQDSFLVEEVLMTPRVS